MPIYIVVPCVPPIEPKKAVYPALYEIWIEQGSKPVAKSWFLGEARKTLNEENNIELSRAKMEEYFRETLTGDSELLVSKGRQSGGGVHYVLTEPLRPKY